MKTVTPVVVLLLAITISPAASFRYLMVAINIGYSHLAFNGRLADILIENGHEVDFIVSRMSPFTPGNGSQLANIIQFTPKSIDKIAGIMKQIPLYADVFQHEVDVFSPEALPLFKQCFELFYSDLLTDYELFDYLKSRHYDAAMSECFDTPAQTIFHLLGIPSVMGTAPTPMSEMKTFELGLPGLPSFVPVLNQSPVSPTEMSFLERAQNFYNYYRSNYVVVPALNELFNTPGSIRGKLFPLDFPEASELKRNMTMLFVNTFELLDLPRPKVTAIRNIGGIVMKEPKKQMDAKTAAIFENARSGVVLLSFGSIVDTTKMNSEIRDAFLDAFAQFPDYQFVWKFVGLKTETLESVFQNYTNVHQMEWIDQTTMLAHPKTRAFISHVGLNSLNEAAYFGVPVVACPFFGDQTYNTAIVNTFGLGVRLNKRKITKETVIAALTEVLTDPGYLRRVQRMSRALHAEADGRVAQFVRDVEFATRFPDELKRKAIPQMSLFVYYSLDVISACLVAGLLALLITGWTGWTGVRVVCSLVSSRKQKTT